MSDSEIDESLLPDRETCDRLCSEFASITNTDSACAQFFLQDRQWDLERSVNAYFEATKSKDDVCVLKDGDEPEVIIRFEGLAAAIAAATGQAEAPKKLKVISWNIDGLDERNLKRRTKFVCNLINCELPDVVFFQEVIPETLSLIHKYLPAYDCICGNDENYFTSILTRKNSVVCDKHEIISFPTTRMGRNLLILKAKIGEVPIVLINSHLESTKEHSGERIKQLKTTFKKALEVKEECTVIVGGDLNLRDSELGQAGGIPAGLEDLWISCGSRAECRYTWDMTRNDNLLFSGTFKPRSRFDRLYIRHSNPARVSCRHFGLIGLERLKSCRRFPSDHWGLVTQFSIE